jgi:hypothetical protein
MEGTDLTTHDRPLARLLESWILSSRGEHVELDSGAALEA